MTGDVVEFAQVMFVIVSSVAGLVAVGLGGRILWRLGSRVGARSQPLPPAADAAQFQRLENAVEAMAIEVERISEAQRFTVAILSERLPSRDRFGDVPALGGIKRNDTPH